MLIKNIMNRSIKIIETVGEFFLGCLYLPYHIVGIIISKVFFEKFGKPMLFQLTPDEEVIQELEKRFPEVFDYLEPQLENKTYLAGDVVSIGDFAVVSNLYNHKACGYKIDEAHWPNVAAYLERMLEEPYIASVITKEREETPLG